MSYQFFKPDERPDHPQAAVMAEQMALLDPLLDGWEWLMHENGSIGVTMRLKDESISLAVMTEEGNIVIDVYTGKVPYHPYMLTWVLMENYGQTHVARAAAPQDGYVPICVVARYPLEDLPQLARLAWDGFEAALTWRGRMWGVEIPEEPEGLSA